VLSPEEEQGKAICSLQNLERESEDFANQLDYPRPTGRE